MDLTEKQEEVLSAQSHLLVTGGPGSGKTTVAIFKAVDLLRKHLKDYQRIIFLSFARASVSRVVEAIQHEHDVESFIKKRIDVDTYHSFFWRILKTHGYLIGLPNKIDVLTPQRESVALSAIRNSFPSGKSISDEEKIEKEQNEDSERARLLYEDGLVGFDFFAGGVSDLLLKSEKIRRLIATKYPIIILDEFQDTNEGQWSAVKSLGLASRIIALADPEQRIYDWIGADPERLQHFRDEFEHDEVDFGQQNHRSSGTEIADFGNDILKGVFTKESYSGINLKLYEPNESLAYTRLVSCVLASIKRVKKEKSDGWSIAILVPTKRMTRKISSVLDNPPGGLPSIFHEPYIEIDAVLLSAEVIAFLLQPQFDEEDFDEFIGLLINYYKGRGGEKPAKGDMEQAAYLEKTLRDYYEKQSQGKTLRANSRFLKTVEVYNRIKGVQHSGSPETDWKNIAKALDDGNCLMLNKVADDAKNIRLLKIGDKIRQDFNSNWRAFGAYSEALKIIRSAFVQQHFATKSKLEQGVLVMNMHKAKGKQFDEVIVFEDWPRREKRKIVSNTGRIVWGNMRDNIDAQARQNFRVSVTRAKLRTTILTPDGDPCVLLID